MSEVLSQGVAVFSETAAEDDLDSENPKSQDLESHNDPYVSPLEGFTNEEVQAAVRELEIIGQIVEQYADAIVICERLGGIEMTLGEAVTAMWPPSVKGAMIIEGVDLVRAEIQRMLDNRLPETETEEAEKEVDSDSDEEGAEESQKDKKDQTETDDTKPAIETENTAQQTESAYTSGSEENFDKNNKAEFELQVATNNPAVAKSRGVTVAPIAETASDLSSVIEEAPKTKPNNVHGGDWDPKLVDVETEEALKAEPDSAEAVVAKKTLSEETEEETNFGLSENLASDVFEDPDEELADDLLTAEDETPEPDEMQYPLDLAPLEFMELEEVVIDHFEAEQSDTNEQEAVEITVEFAADVELEAKDVEPDPDNQLPGDTTPVVVGISHEASATQAETVDISNEGQAAINKSLDKIIELIDSQEANNDEIKEEIKEVIVELFDYLEIEYTPELVEAAVSSIIKYFGEIDKDNHSKKETGSILHDVGTRETLMKILLGKITSVPKTQAYIIGRSALRLYTYDLAMAA